MEARFASVSDETSKPGSPCYGVCLHGVAMVVMALKEHTLAVRFPRYAMARDLGHKGVSQKTRGFYHAKCLKKVYE